MESAFLPMKDLLRVAEEASLYKSPAAIGAFNVNFYAQAEGILEGLKRANSPGIIQASKGACKFQGGPEHIKAMLINAMQGINEKIPLSLHLDHGNLESTIDCINKGFSGVMIDASELSEIENIALSGEVARIAHKNGVSVEGEYGRLMGVEEDIESRVAVYADPLFVPVFFDRSGVDALAIAYGTSHGPNKGNPSALDTSIVEKSYKMMKTSGQNLEHFLVGHGSSTVPKDLVDEINTYGGNLTDASGIPMDKIKEAIRYGLRKVNIDTDLRLGITGIFRKYLFEENPGAEEDSYALRLVKKVFTGETPSNVDPEKITDPRSYLQPIMDSHPEMLRRDYRKSDDEAFREVMQRVKNRVANHVEYLAKEFGSYDLNKKLN